MQSKIQNPKSKIQKFPRSARSGPLFTGQRTGRRYSGWYVGIVIGVLFGLVCMLPVRYTLQAQLAFAFAEDSIPWMRALDSRNGAAERPRLDAAAIAVPGDYLLQLGRATAQTDDAARPAAEDTPADEQKLTRLALLTVQFPTVPGAYAHLLRYMLSSRIHVQRGEIDSHYARAAPPASAPKNEDPPLSPHRPSSMLPLGGDTPRARRRDLQLMVWAAQAGALHDEDNAFWPLMLALAYFSAGRDKEALAALQKASRKTEWNTYIHEEVLGQWRLYSAAYGDNGATQKIAPLSLVAFPHLLEIRRTAEMARALADRAVREGRVDDAVKIRRSMVWTGITMRENARWSFEALCGAYVVLIASSDAGEQNRPVAIISEKEWAKQSANYLALLQKRKLVHEIAWLRDEAGNSCDLRARLDNARSDASYPGIPPGIPLVALFGDWIIGVCLLQQMLGMGFAALFAGLCRRLSPAPPFLRALLRGGALPGAVISGSLLVTGVPTARVALGLVLCLTALALFTMEWVSQRREQETGGEEGREKREKDNAEAIQNPKSKIQNQSIQNAERCWQAGTTGRILSFLMFFGLALLYYFRPELSFLHPIAALLMSVMGETHFATPGDALTLALLACGLPVAFALMAGLWGLYRRVSPLAGAAVGLRRSVFPALACLSLLYLGLLDRTLALDAAASRGISEVAQNDLQWVLTHSAPPEPDSEE